MSAITLPSSPSNGQTHEHLGQIFVFDSTRGYWLLKHEKAFPSTTSRSTFTATEGQTLHNVNYDSGQSIIIIVNGVVLNPQDFTATNGTSITFDTALTLSDEVDIIFHKPTTATLSVNYNDLTNKPTIPADVSDLTDSTGLLSSGVTVYADMAGLIAATGMSAGAQALVTATNNIYVYTGAGWFKIATVQNDSPSAITGVNGTYELAVDGSPTTITAVSTDPEGFPLTWSYTTSGLGSIATVSNTNGVFTITPSTVEANAGTFTLTISATDGVNGAVSASSNITLEFIVTITNSRYTTILATATSAGDNDDITDSSSNNYNITLNGAPFAGTFSPYRHGGYSTRVTSDDRLEASGFTISGSWTFEFWYKLPTGVTLDNYQTIASFGQSNGTNCRLFRFMQDPSGKFALDFSGGGGAQNFYTHNVAYNQDQWYHICATYDATANTEKIYIDGTEVYSVSFTANYTGVTTAMVGQERTDSSTLAGTPKGKGIFRDFHVIGNAAVVPASGGSSKVELQSGSVLLLFSDGTLNDVSTSNCTISASQLGAFDVLVDTPYDNVEYDSTVHGGSIYMVPNNEYLILPTGDYTFTGDFTIEGWLYQTTSSSGADCSLYVQSNGGYFAFNVNSANNRLNIYLNSGSANWQPSMGGRFVSGVWNHMVLQRSGTTIEAWVNGQSIGTTTNSSTLGYNITGTLHRIGGGASGNYWQVSDFRIMHSAVYSGNFTPPIQPLPSTNSVIHVKGTDASIVDKAQGSNLKQGSSSSNVVGATTITDPFGGSLPSIYISATTHFIQTVNDIPAVGTGDFTGEAWVWRPSFANYRTIMDNRTGSNTANRWHLAIDGSGQVYFYTNAFIITSSISLTINTWHHVAITRQNGTCRLFIDGTERGSATNTSSFNDTKFAVGSQTGYSNSFSSGYIFDARFTIGLARYTSNFTPPTESLKG